LLTKARSEKHIKVLKEWFEGGYVFNSKGEKLTDVELSLKHKHTIMERIWSSFEISLDEKERLLSILESQDKSDWIENTKKCCKSAHPGTKQ